MDLTPERKVQVTGAVIRLAQERDKVTVRLSPEYYVRELDSLIARYVQTNDQKALKGSVGVTWKTIAVMEGDWDNGQDPLDYAQSFMGSALFDMFRRAYPNKYQHLLDLHAQRQTNH